MTLFLIVMLWLMFFRILRLQREVKCAEDTTLQWKAAAEGWHSMYTEAARVRRKRS